MSERYAIIDGSYLAYRAIFSGSHMITSNGLCTGGVLIFLKALYNYREHGNLIVVFDSARSVYRMQIYPEYKYRGEVDPNAEVNEQLEECKRFTFPSLVELLPKMGIPVVKMAGQEGDDIAYRLAEHLTEQGHKVSVLSDDEDWIQFIRLGCNIVKPMKQSEVNKNNFQEHYPFPPEYFIFYKAMVGDDSDNITNVPKIGEKTAEKLIGEMRDPTIKSLIEVAKAGTKAYHKSMADNVQILKRNLMLMNLQNAPLSKEEVIQAYEVAKTLAVRDLSQVMNKFKMMELNSLSNWIVHLQQRKS